MIKKVLNHFPIIIVFTLYIILSLFTYKDYGITADEELEYKLGKNLVNYFINEEKYLQNETLNNKPYLKYYYHFYPMTISILNPTEYYEWYHLINMLFATLIIFSSYILLYKEYKNKYLAIIGPLAILLTPSFLGSIPANPKDIPFAIMYFLSISFIYIWGNTGENTAKKTGGKGDLPLTRLIILGIIIGITQSLRIIGYSLYVIYIVNIFIQKPKSINTKEKLKYYLQNHLGSLSIIAIISHLIMYLTYPYIRESILNVVNLFLLSKNFTPWDRTILYFGDILNREQRPWHYLFTYILTTTPIFILVTHILSIKYIKEDKLLKILFFTLSVNLIAYIVMKPIIYNGLRHFLYILPLIATTSAIFIIKTLKNNQDKNRDTNINVNRYKKFIPYIYGIFGGLIIIQIIKTHPYEYIYFNYVTRKVFNIKVEDTLETDYWGASYKEATKKLINYIEKNNIDNPKVYACNVDYSVRYYSEYKFDLVNTRQKANFIICDYQNDKQMKNDQYKIIDVIEKDKMPLNIIRETKY